MPASRECMQALRLACMQSHAAQGVRAYVHTIGGEGRLGCDGLLSARRTSPTHHADADARVAGVALISCTSSQPYRDACLDPGHRRPHIMAPSACSSAGVRPPRLSRQRPRPRQARRPRQIRQEVHQQQVHRARYTTASASQRCTPSTTPVSRTPPPSRGRPAHPPARAHPPHRLCARTHARPHPILLWLLAAAFCRLASSPTPPPATSPHPLRGPPPSLRPGMTRRPIGTPQRPRSTLRRLSCRERHPPRPQPAAATAMEATTTPTAAAARSTTSRGRGRATLDARSAAGATRAVAGVAEAGAGARARARGWGGVGGGGARVGGCNGCWAVSGAGDGLGVGQREEGTAGGMAPYCLPVLRGAEQCSAVRCNGAGAAAGCAPLSLCGVARHPLDAGRCAYALLAATRIRQQLCMVPVACRRAFESALAACWQPA